MGGMGGGGPPPERLFMFDENNEAQRRRQAGLRGATVGAFGTLAAMIYNLDDVENATERLQNASWQPYLQNDAPRVAELQRYDSTMSKYTDALREATNTSDLEATLQPCKQTRHCLKAYEAKYTMPTPCQARYNTLSAKRPTKRQRNTPQRRYQTQGLLTGTH